MEFNGLLSVKQVAEELGVSPHMIRALVRQGRIPHVQVGRRVLFDPKDIENFIESHKIPARDLGSPQIG